MKKPNSQPKNNTIDQTYRGRFAPSPSGELHFGSLLAAMASYADARAHNGQWLLRIDNIDQARMVPDSAEHIIQTLEQLGFEWDENIYYQSRHIRDYRKALDVLHEKNLTYPCFCSRKQIKSRSSNGIYPGTCRPNNQTDKTTEDKECALRIKVPDKALSFKDQIQGDYTQQLAQDVGDFIIYRRDKVFTYQLSIVVDEYLSNITHIVRGHDLLDSTPRQIYLQQQLDFPTPVYAHIPLAVTPQQLKLSKLSRARKVRCDLPTLIQAARFLRQDIAPDNNYQSLQDFWQHLFDIWQLKQVPKMEKIEIIY